MWSTSVTRWAFLELAHFADVVHLSYRVVDAEPVVLREHDQNDRAVRHGEDEPQGGIEHARDLPADHLGRIGQFVICYDVFLFFRNGTSRRLPRTGSTDTAPSRRFRGFGILGMLGFLPF